MRFMPNAQRRNRLSHDVPTPPMGGTFRPSCDGNTTSNPTPQRDHASRSSTASPAVPVFVLHWSKLESRPTHIFCLHSTTRTGQERGGNADIRYATSRYDDICNSREFAR